MTEAEYLSQDTEDEESESEAEEGFEDDESDEEDSQSDFEAENRQSGSATKKSRTFVNKDSASVPGTQTQKKNQKKSQTQTQTVITSRPSTTISDPEKHVLNYMIKVGALRRREVCESSPLFDRVIGHTAF